MADITIIVTPPAPIVVQTSVAAVQFPQVVEANSSLEETALFSAGAKIVIRKDLL